jgi:spermidine synthase
MQPPDSARAPRGQPCEASSRASLATIALVACALIVYEIAITRVLSVVLWYHFAFLAISLAMLGLGAPGVWFSLRPPGAATLRRSLLGCGIAVPVSIAVITKSAEILPRTEWVVPLAGPSMHLTGLTTAVVIVSVLVPMLFMGSAICLLLLQVAGARIGRMYGADLLGATLGALLVVPLMDVLPTPSLVAGCGLLPLAGVMLLRDGNRALRGGNRAALAVAALTLVALFAGAPFRLHSSKVYFESDLGLLHEKWTPTARLTVFDRPLGPTNRDAAFGWGMGSRFEPKPVEQLWIEQDGSAGTPITRLDGSLEALGHLDYDVTSVGYQLRPPDVVCVIGAGGGRDILTALRAGAKHVDAVELNPHMIRIVNDVFGEYSGRVYELPHVHAHASEGRSFLTRSDRRYDLIQISLIDSWAATSAGAYALSENYLYTIEALRLYWQRLAEGGLLSMSRWMVAFHQMEVTRLALLARESLEREGVARPGEHIAVMKGGGVGTVLVSRDPLDTAAIERLDAIAAARGFERHWPPPRRDRPDSLVARALAGQETSVTRRGLTLTPPTDDRPFFFQMVQVFGDLDPRLRLGLSVNDVGARLLKFLLPAMTAIAVLLFFSPFALAGRFRRHPQLWRGSAYFAAIGLAFMLVEAPWIQKFVLYLGHPSYATTFVLAGILLGAGVGSIAAGSWDPGRVVRWRFALPATIAVVNLTMAAVFQATLGWPVWLRVLLGLLAVVPSGFLMGFAFPVGILRFGDGNKAWFWAMNGALSVVASVASVALAMQFGLANVVWIGVAAYGGACLLLGGGFARAEAADIR